MLIAAVPARSLPDISRRVALGWTAERQLPLVTDLVGALTRAEADPDVIARGRRYAADLEAVLADALDDVNTLAVTTWIATARDVLSGFDPSAGHPGERAPGAGHVTVIGIEGADGRARATVERPRPVAARPASEQALGTASLCLVAAVGVATFATVLIGSAPLGTILRVTAVAAWAAWSVTLLWWALVTGRVRAAVGWWLAAPVTAPWLAWRFGDHRRDDAARS